MPLVLSGLQCVSKKRLLLFGGGIGEMFTWWVLCITYPQTTVLKKPKGEREKKPTHCPTAIADYNKYMGGGGSPSASTPELLFNEHQTYTEVVEKGILEVDRCNYH